MPTLSPRFLVPSCFKALLPEKFLCKIAEILRSKNLTGRAHWSKPDNTWLTQAVFGAYFWPVIVVSYVLMTLEVMNGTGIMEQGYYRVNLGNGEINGGI